MTTRTQHRAPLPLLVLWIALYFGVRLFLESNTVWPASGRLLLALLPVPVFAAFLWSFVAMVRAADELERRIQLEALAMAFPLGLLVLTSLGLAQRAVALNMQDWSYNHVWPVFAVLYFLGVAVARRRYA